MYDYPGTNENDEIRTTLEAKLAAQAAEIAELKIRCARIEGEHKSLLETCAFRVDFEMFTAATDQRLTGVPLRFETAQPTAVVAETPHVPRAMPDATPSEIAALRDELRETRALLVSAIHLLVPALASGHVSTEKAAALIDRASALAGRAVTGERRE